MAAITGSRDQKNTTHRSLAMWRDEWTPTALTASVIVAIALALGTLWVGLVVAGLFVAGNGIVAFEGRSLDADEFAAISTLHAAAAVVLALSL